VVYPRISRSSIYPAAQNMPLAARRSGSPLQCTKIGG
jgi:hypothetical protein